jgi:hypothetical protein
MIELLLLIYKYLKNIWEIYGYIFNGIGNNSFAIVSDLTFLDSKNLIG